MDVVVVSIVTAGAEEVPLERGPFVVKSLPVTIKSLYILLPFLTLSQSTWH